MLRRIPPVLLLLVLSPLLAEYLSGSMAMTQLKVMPVFIAMYGAGAVLVRETTRRAGRGFATIVLLGLAYGILEEGILDQTLFNPHFHGLRLLDYGYIPALGIAVPWTLYVLSIHVVWSIAVPIAITEAVFGGKEPWLRLPGLTIIALLFAAGCFAVFTFTAKLEHFMASPVQLAASAAAVAIAIAAAFLVPRGVRDSEAPVNAWVVGLVSFCASSAFVELYGQGAMHLHLPWPAVAAGLALIAIAMLLFGLRAGRSAGWSDKHRAAMAGGALLTYCWTGFFTERSLHAGATVLPHALLAGAMVLLLALAVLRARRMA